MKILVATGIYPPDIGGPATYSKLLESELPKRDIETLVVSYSLVRHLPRGISHLVYLYTLLKNSFNKDIIYAMDPISVGLPAMVVAKILRKKFYLKIVGDYAWEQGRNKFGIKEHLDDFHKDTSYYHFFVKVLIYLEKFVARSADQIIVPSKYLKKVVGMWGIPKEDIEIIYNSVGDIDKANNRRTLRGLLKFNGKLIVSIGRLVEWKGFSVLLDAIVDLKKDFPKLKFMIIGSGPLYDELGRKIETLGLQDSVSLAGSLDREITMRYVEAADVFVLNTAYEGLSHTLLEAMSVGTPIITTNVGGNPELIEDNKSGFLVKYNNKKAFVEKIKTILNSQSIGRRVAQGAKQKVQSFSKEKMLDDLISILKS